MKFKTLGCRLNTFETETIKSITEKLDFKNLTFVNTCSVTKEASKNSKKYVRQLKKSSPHNTVIVSGCDAQIEKETYMKMPEVDVVIGNNVKLNESIWGGIKKNGRSGFFGKLLIVSLWFFSPKEPIAFFIAKDTFLLIILLVLLVNC